MQEEMVDISELVKSIAVELQESNRNEKLSLLLHPGY